MCVMKGPSLDLKGPRNPSSGCGSWVPPSYHSNHNHYQPSFSGRDLCSFEPWARTGLSLSLSGKAQPCPQLLRTAATDADVRCWMSPAARDAKCRSHHTPHRQ
eukprot:5812043-Amphidinium_carterae.1